MHCELPFLVLSMTQLLVDKMGENTATFSKNKSAAGFINIKTTRIVIFERLTPT